MIAVAKGGVFGLSLETAKAANGETVPSGAIMIKQEQEISVLLPSSKDPLYFSALMLWTYFSGDTAKAFAKDNRLPDFIRKTIAELAK